MGQLAKHDGLKVIGSVGDDQKLEFITKELGFDGGFNYKKEKPLDALQRLAPDGIDIYYENVRLSVSFLNDKRANFILSGWRRTARSRNRSNEDLGSHHRLRHDLPIQQAPTRSIRREESDAGCGQAYQNARLHCEYIIPHIDHKILLTRRL